MKKLSCSLMIALLMGLSVHTFAQKSTAFLNSETSKQVADEKTVVVTFRLDNITDNATRLRFETALKNGEGVQEVHSTEPQGNVSVYTMKMDKQRAIERLEKIFQQAGIETVNVDGTAMPTSELVSYKRSQKAKK
ncbi:MAG: hypothetical protein JWO44_2219 [Bacteroidetes bacterium]|nr:hypothetical protein [Bacteroidota bacterium]